MLRYAALFIGTDAFSLVLFKIKLCNKTSKYICLAGQLLARCGTFFAGGAVYLNNGSYLLYSKCYLVCGG